MEEKQLVVGMLQLIDVGTSRGAWQGAELEAVALMRKTIVEKIKTFNEESDDVDQDMEDVEESVDKAH